MDLTALIAASVALSLNLVLILGVRIAWNAREPLLKAVFSRHQSETQGRLEILEEFVETLPGVYEGFATEARKARQRATWHVSRVRKELEKHGLVDPELEELSSRLQPVDAEGSEESGLLALHTPVAESSPETEAEMMGRAFEQKWSRRYG